MSTLPDPSGHRRRPATHLRQSGKIATSAIVVIAFLLCATLTGLLYFQEKGDAEQYAELQFQRRVELRTVLIEKGMMSYEKLLLGGVGLFAADAYISVDDWRRYVETARLEKNYPGAQGLGYAPYIPTDERGRFERNQRNAGDDDFVIWPETDQPFSAPIMLLEPSNLRNTRAIGYDMYAETTRRRAMNRARELGRPIMSDTVTLVQETMVDTQLGFLVYAPVYSDTEGRAFDGAGFTKPMRKNQLRGFVFSPFRMNDLIWGIMGEDNFRLLRLQIFDGQSDQGKLIFDSLDSTPGDDIAQDAAQTGLPEAVTEEPSYVHASRFRFARNNWTLKFSSLPSFESSVVITRPRFILVGGLFISALVAIILAYWFALRQRATTLAIVNASLQSALIRQAQAEKELNRFFNLAPDVLCILDSSGLFLRINAATRLIFGCDPVALLNKPFSNVLHSTEHESLSTLLDKLRDKQDTPLTEEFRTHGPNGSELILEWAFIAVPEHNQIYVAGRDVTARQAALVAKRQLIAAMESTSDIIFFCDETGYISYLNYRGRALITPATIDAFTADVFASDALPDMDFNIYDFTPPWAVSVLNSEAFPYATAHGGWRGDISILIQGGREVPVALVLEAHYSPDGSVEFFAGNMRDISRRKAIQADLERKAYHDELTGLINRQGFNERLERTIADAQEHNVQSALLFIDLDHFKIVNDSCGHAAGDEVLIQLSRLFSQQIRDRDTLARLGGDEFTVILEHCQVKDALQVAQGIVQAASDFRYFSQGQSFRFGTSVGLVPIDRKNGNAKQIMTAADEAAYKAKSNGRSQVVVYEGGDREGEQLQVNTNWKQRLQLALRHDRFTLLYQPIVAVDAASSGIRLREVLIRLNDESELISPAAFLPAAERFGLISAIDYWVIETVVSKLQQQDPEQRNGEIYAINLSAQSLGEANFADRVIALVAERGVDSSALCFELAENTVLQNPDTSRQFIQRMKSFGLQITLQHFGMSISEFANLQQLGVDFLKIDSWFIEKMLRSPLDEQSVRFVNDVGHTMGLKTIAGAVSDKAIETRLRELGVDFLQGYQMGEPGPDEI
ncbi:hypothetical protein GCM10022278_16390 [Allohahella marinimesophila]|uniref:PAS domain S-box-containing protein/diguanylate cyclase (GGDEF)-like protein n=2 Tax=Allohahella marinimesophila TaxID=1054972 RepID=A0ABP7P2R2_9GAMM